MARAPGDHTPFPNVPDGTPTASRQSSNAEKDGFFELEELQQKISQFHEEEKARFALLNEQKEIATREYIEALQQLTADSAPEAADTSERKALSPEERTKLLRICESKKAAKNAAEKKATIGKLIMKHAELKRALALEANHSDLFPAIVEKTNAALKKNYETAHARAKTANRKLPTPQSAAEILLSQLSLHQENKGGTINWEWTDTLLARLKDLPENQTDAFDSLAATCLLSHALLTNDQEKITQLLAKKPNFKRTFPGFTLTSNLTLLGLAAGGSSNETVVTLAQHLPDYETELDLLIALAKQDRFYLIQSLFTEKRLPHLQAFAAQYTESLANMPATPWVQKCFPCCFTENVEDIPLTISTRMRDNSRAQLLYHFIEGSGERRGGSSLRDDLSHAETKAAPLIHHAQGEILANLLRSHIALLAPFLDAEKAPAHTTAFPATISAAANPLTIFSAAIAAEQAPLITALFQVYTREKWNQLPTETKLSIVTTGTTHANESIRNATIAGLRTMHPEKTHDELTKDLSRVTSPSSQAL